MRLFTHSMLCLCAVFCAALLCAQDAPPAQKKGGGGAPKNLKLLKPEDVRPAMGAYRAALGVQCDFCHVQDRSSDENPKKEVARHMIVMVREINGQATDVNNKVTCYTCHRGASEPLSAPPAAGGM